MKEIVYYTKKDGKCPFKQWLLSVDNIIRHRIEQRLYRVAEGNYGDCKQLKNSELSELRIMTNKGYRIYFKDIENTIILILAGSDKSDQKRVIDKANEYWNEFKERYMQND